MVAREAPMVEQSPTDPNTYLLVPTQGQDPKHLRRLAKNVMDEHQQLTVRPLASTDRRFHVIDVPVDSVYVARIREVGVAGPSK